MTSLHSSPTKILKIPNHHYDAQACCGVRWWMVAREEMNIVVGHDERHGTGRRQGRGRLAAVDA
jgi:hypothetical protein